MNLTDRGKAYLGICLLAFVFSFFIVTLRLFPHFGMALSLLIFAVFSYKYKKVKDKDTKVYLIFTLLFPLFLFIRSEPLITFINLVATLFFGFLMLLPKQKEGLAFADHIYAPILFAIKSVFTTGDYYLEFKEKKKYSEAIKITEVVFGILITILLLLVVLPILSSANPFFQRLVSDTLNFLSLENLLKHIGYENIFIWVIRVLLFLFFIFIIPKVLILINKSHNYTLGSQFQRNKLPLLIPKIVLTIILFIFFITQLQFYFADAETLNNLGLSYSQHTREVFAQLSLVAGIVLLLVYNDSSKSSFSRILNWILGVQGIFLTLMAYKSVAEYINAWGLTYKRLYGLTFATWTTGIFVLFFNNYRQKNIAMVFVKNTIIFSGVMLLLVNVLNFDYLIYHLGKAETVQGTDYTYLSTLSSDSLSYKEQFMKLEEVAGQGEYSLEVYNNKNPKIILYKIETLQKKYAKLDFRTLNVLDYLQYRQVKSIDTGKLREQYKNWLIGR